MPKEFTDGINMKFKRKRGVNNDITLFGLSVRKA